MAKKDGPLTGRVQFGPGCQPLQVQKTKMGRPPKTIGLELRYKVSRAKYIGFADGPIIYADEYL